MPFRRGPGSLCGLLCATSAVLATAIAAPGAAAQSQPVRGLVQDVTATGAATAQATGGQVASATRPVREAVRATLDSAVGDVRAVVGQATTTAPLRPLADSARQAVGTAPALPPAPASGDFEPAPPGKSRDLRDARGLGAARSLRSPAQADGARSAPALGAPAIALPAVGLLAKLDRPSNAIASALSESGDGRDDSPGNGPGGGGDVAGPIAAGLLMAAVLVALLLLAPRVVTRIVRVTALGGGLAVFFTPVEWPD